MKEKDTLIGGEIIPFITRLKATDRSAGESECSWLRRGDEAGTGATWKMKVIEGGTETGCASVSALRCGIVTRSSRTCESWAYGRTRGYDLDHMHDGDGY